jgi:hypothetical protein
MGSGSHIYLPKFYGGFIWRNFVSSRRERIEQAKADWENGRIILRPNDDKEFVPLPKDKSRPAGSPPPNALS